MPVKRRRHGRGLFAGCTAAVLLALAGGWWVAHYRREPAPVAAPVYVSMEAVRREYGYLLGRRLEKSTAAQIERANGLAAAGDTLGAIAVLRAAATGAPVPAVYNNLGVLYARMNDGLNARQAYAAALQRAPSYQAARTNLKLLRVGADAPVVQEVEPNDSPARANNIRLGVPVTGAVENPSDVDFYRFRTPPRPRDLLEVSVTGAAAELAPAVRVYDSQSRVVVTGGAREVLGLEPDTDCLVEVFGERRTSGTYTIRVKALRAFDQYEPNDDPAHAVTIQPGVAVRANIMDGQDADYFQFHSPRNGKVTAAIENPSATLLPAVTVLGPDLRVLGFSPQKGAGGEGVAHAFDAVAGDTYYLQVWGRKGSAGEYSVAVK